MFASVGRWGTIESVENYLWYVQRCILMLKLRYDNNLAHTASSIKKPCHEFGVKDPWPQLHPTTLGWAGASTETTLWCPKSVLSITNALVSETGANPCSQIQNLMISLPSTAEQINARGSGTRCPNYHVSTYFWPCSTVTPNRRLCWLMKNDFSNMFSSGTYNSHESL